MILPKYLNSLNKEQTLDQIEDRQGFIAKAKRGLPLIEAKMIKYPGWHATCPKSGEPLTLDIIQDELQAYLEVAEEELPQFEGHLVKLEVPNSIDQKYIPKVKKPEYIQVPMELGVCMKTCRRMT